ncbi:MAG: alanine racemase [Bacteroidota bacterium]
MDSLHHVWIEISFSNLAHNLEQIKQHTPGKKILGIVKKNAYGHGLVEVGKRLAKLDVDYLGVIYPFEGIQLRDAGVEKPILVLGATLPTDIRGCLDKGLEFSLLSMDHLSAVEKASVASGNKGRVHIKIDTGMNRIGVPWNRSEALIKAALASKHVEIIGLFSHLASADTPNVGFSKVQVDRLQSAVNYFESAGGKKPLIHLAASGGILHYPETHFDMVRPGHLLYGVYPDHEAERSLDLRPVLSLHARVAFTKKIDKGATVGYGQSWTATKSTHISTVPIGYGDGYPRGLRNQCQVMARGQLFPVVGSVCMDQIMVDTGEIQLEPGEEVVLVGRHGKHSIKVEELAKVLNTVPDDLLSGFHIDIPRNFS